MNLNSVELHALHEENGGSDLSHRLLVIRLLQYFGDSLVASLSSLGIATIWHFKMGQSRLYVLFQTKKMTIVILQLPS